MLHTSKLYLKPYEEETVMECVCVCVCVFQPVILKELKHTDGSFSENQRIELNTVRLQTLCHLLYVRHFIAVFPYLCISC